MRPLGFWQAGGKEKEADTRHDIHVRVPAPDVGNPFRPRSSVQPGRTQRIPTPAPLTGDEGAGLGVKSARQNLHLPRPSKTPSEPPSASIRGCYGFGGGVARPVFNCANVRYAVVEYLAARSVPASR